jgi:hypothetical protein
VSDTKRSRRIPIRKPLANERKSAPSPRPPPTAPRPPERSTAAVPRSLALLEAWQGARAAGDWPKADRLMEQLEQLADRRRVGGGWDYAIDTDED